MPYTTRRDFLKQLGLGFVGLTLAESALTDALGRPLRTGSLPRSLPEAQGVSSAGLLGFINKVEQQKLNLHSLMVVRHGHVVAEGWWAPYAPQYRHTLYSLSKSFTSTAVGMAIAEGKLSLDDKIVSFFPNDLPATVSPHLAAMRIRDLLSMSTGHAKDATPALRLDKDGNWPRAFLAQPVEHEPGTFFVYNSGATYMLSNIVQQRVGQPLLDYLKPRLFTPLDIRNADWEVDPKGVDTGGWGLRVRTEDIAKFGQLYLQKGMWQGKRLLPERWVADATQSHISSKGGSGGADVNDWVQGYGYQFWRCRHNAYRGDGAFGQYCIVMPDQDAVIAITSETSNMQAILNQVWENILPAMQAKPQPADANQKALKQKLAQLAFVPPVVQLTSPRIADVTNKTYDLNPNALGLKAVKLTFKPNEAILTLTDDKGPREVRCGLGEWRESLVNVSPLPLKLVPTTPPNELPTTLAATGTWTDDATFEMIWRFIETAHYEVVKCQFEGDAIQVSFRKSLSVLDPNNKDSRPVLEGKRRA